MAPSATQFSTFNRTVQLRRQTQPHSQRPRSLSVSAAWQLPWLPGVAWLLPSPAQVNPPIDWAQRDRDTAEFLAPCRAMRAHADEVMAEFEAKAAKQDEQKRREQTQAAVSGTRPQAQPALPAATPAAPWPPAVGSVTACRTAAAEASAAATLVWAAEAMRLEAKAEASAAQMGSDPAAERTQLALEWQAAAAAWRTASEQLEYARQADPQAVAVQQAEQLIYNMRGFKRQCQQWGEAS